MASPSTPSGPNGPLVARPSTPVSTPSPGNWRHPRFDEIARRQHATTFDTQNARRVIFHVSILSLTFVIAWVVKSLASPHDMNAIFITILQWGLFLVRLYLGFNILIASLPLLRRKDDLSDIPLTPSQRALLGLAPASSTTPTTPTTQYVTPPRYPRSTTPRSGSTLSRSSSYSGSPLSGKGSPYSGRPVPGSPFSPSSPSPLLQKAIGGGSRDSSRRHSYGSPSPLGAGTNGRSSGIGGLPSTPSPVGGKGASVGLNSRWLYEKMRSSPNRSPYS